MRQLDGVLIRQKLQQRSLPDKLGIFHGMKSYFCQDEYGQIAPVYSISAGLDYPGVGPEHAHLYDTGRAEYVPVTDDEAVDAFEYLSKDRRYHPGDRERPCSCVCEEAGADDGKESDCSNYHLRKGR